MRNSSGHAISTGEQSQDGIASQNQLSVGEEKDVKLKRQIGIFSGTCLVVNMMIGSGIFVVPSGVLKYCNGDVYLSIVVWAVGGAIAMIGALCALELATSLRVSGSWVSFLHYSLGGLPSFLYAWMMIFIAYPEGSAAQATAVGEYMTRWYFKDDCKFPLLPTVQKMLGASVFLVVIVINMVNVKLAVRLQSICAIGKTVSLVSIIVTGIVQLARDTSVAKQNFYPSSGNTTDMIGDEGYSFGSGVGAHGFGIALYQGLWAYDGFGAITFVTEEVKNPARSLPIISYLAIPIVTLLYIFVNVAYFSVLTPAEILSSNAVVVTFGHRIHPFMEYLMTLTVCLSLIGTMNAAQLIIGRVPFVSGRLGHMPELLSMAHVHYVSPVPALLLNASLGILMLSSSSFEVLITASLFAEWGFKGLAFAGILYLRKKRPNLQRPYKVFKLTAVIAILVSIFLLLVPLVFQEPEPLYVLSVVFTGLFAGFYTLIWKGILKMTGIGRVGLFVQKLLLIVPTTKEDIGS